MNIVCKPYTKALQIILASFLCVTLLTSCGGTLAYDRLDWLIPWYVDSYVDLSREQRQTLREQLAPLLRQHRQEELVRYQQLLDEFETDLESPVSQAQVESWGEDLLQSVERVEQSMIQVAVEFGASISDAQMAEFVESLYSRQNELEEELLGRSDEKYAKENAAHLEDLLKRFIGRLDSNQKLQLQKGAQAMQRFDEVWLKDRRLWLDEIKPILQRESGWQAQLLQAYQERENDRSEIYRDIVNHNKGVIAAAIAEVFNSRNGNQIARTKREIEDLRSMLQKLIDNAPGDPQPDRADG